MKSKFNVILENAMSVLFFVPVVAICTLFVSAIVGPQEAAELYSASEPQSVLLEVEITADDVFEMHTDTLENKKPIIESTTDDAETKVEEVKYYDIPLSNDLQDYIFELSENRGLDPAIIIGIIYRESGYDSGAIGDSGNSLGLMQIQPRWNGERMNELGCPDLLDPYQNVAVGIDCFADYVDQSGSIEWSLMAYNGGPGYANNLWSNGQISSYATSVLSYADNIRNN